MENTDAAEVVIILKKVFCTTEQNQHNTNNITHIILPNKKKIVSLHSENEWEKTNKT